METTTSTAASPTSAAAAASSSPGPSSAGTNRLRRRSFFENMEQDSSSSSTLDAVSLQDGPGGTMDHHGHSGGDHSAVHSVDGATDHASAGSSSASSAHGHHHHHQHGGPWANQSFLGFLASKLWYMRAWCIVKWQALVVNGRLARFSLRPLVPLVGKKTGEALVVKQWAYPTHWIKLACLSLAALQVAIYWSFQVEPLDLHVEECIFHERMMPAVPARERILAGGGGGGGGGGGALGGRGGGGGGGATSNAAALRFLERRFELQHGHVLAQHHTLRTRLPWTCIALVPVLPPPGPEEASAGAVIRRQAQELAVLLPRSQVLESAAAVARGAVASRLHLALGASPGVPITRGPHTGVLAALFPLAAFRPETLFPRGFPDLVLVKSEYALKKLVLYRHERAEEFQHRIAAEERAAAPRPTALSAHDHAPQDDETNPHANTNTNAEDPIELERSRTQFGVFLMKTTVPDIYNRHVRKDWDAFLHVVVISEQDKREQFTKELLALWLQHPEWPVLHVRFQQSLPLCGSFRRFLSSFRQMTNDDGELVADRHDGTPPANVDLSCDPTDNTREAIVRLKNAIGMHLFPVPPEMEVHEELVLESAAAGAIVVTYNTPIMHEWIPDACGVRVGSYDLGAAAADGSTLELPVVHVTSTQIESAIEGLLKLDRVHRVAAGRAARVQYLEIRTHYLSAVAALDNAICDFDNDESLEQQHEIGQRSRKKVDIDMIRVFLY